LFCKEIFLTKHFNQPSLCEFIFIRIENNKGMKMKLNLDLIQTPTLILNKEQAKRNIQRMADKAAVRDIRFRPHFKTHQSALIGEWFRDAGVTEITVSSFAMAEYFADNGWKDILIAFPVNLREIDQIRSLADRIHLGLLVDMEDSIKKLQESIHVAVDIWIKIDTGLKRAGVWWEDVRNVEKIIKHTKKAPKFYLKGLLTHAGQTYVSNSRDEVLELYQESNFRMNHLRDQLNEKGFQNLELSVGDTPGCWLSTDLGQVDEIRPGNFLLFDAEMMQLGVCHPSEIAASVACPIVSIFPHRQEIVIYGGAVHLSKETIVGSNPAVFGYAVFSPDSASWEINPGNFVRSLSQEHGVVKLHDEYINKVRIGDLIYIVPVHSCLVVDALGKFVSFEGDVIHTRVG
jgi:D-serine deaminase-like pyridoxal phosphate-dependent protein